MSYVVETMTNLAAQTGFAFLKPGNFIMILVALVFLYLAIAKGYEPLLLVPISFGMLLVNLYPSIMEEGGLLHYFYLLDEWSILPSLIFLGVGALTDFGPLIANPASFLLGAAAQFGIYSAYFLAMLMGFNGKAAAAISIIGGADGPTSIFLAGKLGQTDLMGPIAVAAYSYMSLVPIIQPPIMKLLTTEKERKIKMEQLRPVSRLEKILFPIIVTIVVCVILPTTAPLVGMLMLGNLFRESGVVRQLTETASNAMMYIVVILLGTSIQAVLKTFEIPRPILYRKEIRKNGRQLVGYENATGRPIVPFGKYARCHTPIISENRIGIVETDEGKFIAIDHTGKKLFEIMFQSPVLSVEDLFRYGYFIYVTRNGRQGVATISGLRYTQPTHKPINLSDVDRDAIKALIL